MNSHLVELDYRHTSLGELILRRRRSTGGDEVYEVKLDGSFLMSSLVNESEIALADLALKELAGTSLDVVVGGLGLGYTAVAALNHPNVTSVLVVEHLQAVIDWHLKGLVPMAKRLVDDERCHLIKGDFFALLRDDGGFDPSARGRQFDAILVDIDHTPRHPLHPSHADFYEPDGLRRVAERLHPRGVFALWSADPPDEEILSLLRSVFEASVAHPVTFRNTLLNRDDINTVYVARRGS